MEEEERYRWLHLLKGHPRDFRMGKGTEDPRFSRTYLELAKPVRKNVSVVLEFVRIMMYS